MGGFRDLTGQKFGKLTAIKKLYVYKSKWVWLWECECGIKKEIVGTEVTQGHTKSCGCGKVKHGDTKSNGWTHRLYKIYHGMKKRCLDENNPEFHNYGGRGVTVCDEWLSSYITFKEWAEKNNYKEGLTLDRIDVNGDYSPENCKWSTVKEQNNNKRNTIFVEINGTLKSLSEWADETGIYHVTLYCRYKRGITGEELIKPVKNIGQKNSNIENISWSRQKKKWSVRFKINNSEKTSIVIGYYDELDEAIKVKNTYIEEKRVI